MKDLIAIVPYFNYFGNPHMEGNLGRVLGRLREQGVPVLVAEAVLEGEPFLLPPGPGVIQRRSRSVLWQKERLINLALESVAGEYTNAAWIDNDLLMPDGWDSRLLEALERRPLVQLYRSVEYLDAAGVVEAKIPGFAHVLETMEFPLWDKDNRVNPGAAWGARCAALEGIGLYDRYVTCGSDTMMGVTLSQMRLILVEGLRLYPKDFNLLLNRETSRHHREWDQRVGKRLTEMTGGSKPGDWVGYLPEDIPHLYHGPYRKRNYMARHQILFENAFDPYLDLTHNQEGLLEWATAKYDMHRRIRQSFVSQNDRVRF